MLYSKRRYNVISVCYAIRIQTCDQSSGLVLFGLVSKSDEKSKTEMKTKSDVGEQPFLIKL